MGTVKSDWQDVNKVLGLFGDHRLHAKRQYAEFVGKGVSEGQKPEFTGGGLIRSVGGWHALSDLRRMKIHFIAVVQKRSEWRTFLSTTAYAAILLFRNIILAGGINSDRFLNKFWKISFRIIHFYTKSI